MTISRFRILAGLLATATAFVMTLQATNAAFSAQTENAANSIAAGTVVLSDDDSGTAMFSVTNMKPGDTSVGCVEVTYAGTLDPEVRVFGATTGGDGLEGLLDLTIERGDGDCTTFGSATSVWTTGGNGDLGVFLGSATAYASGVDSWLPTGGGADDTVPYRFTIELQDDNAAQGKSTTVTFTWEAQNL